MKRFLIYLVYLAVLAALPSCSDPEPVVYQRPSAKEKAVRTAFVDSQPDLPPVVKRQVLAFEATPEAVLRRVDYVRANPGLPGGLKQRILTGNVRLHMKKEHVRAAWGEPTSVEVKGESERWVYPSFSRTDPSREVELFFRNGEVVGIRN